MEDEKDLSVDNDDSSVQEVDNTDDADVNNDNPSTDDASSRKAGNGYNGLASSNREAFARGLNDNYSDRIARNRANLEAARARSNSNQKEIKDKDGNESLKDKNGLDKLGDKANVLKNKASLLSSQVDNLRSKAFMVTNPAEASKMVVKKKVTAWIVASLAASLPVILPIIAFIVVIFAVIGIFDGMNNSNVAGGGSSGLGSFNLNRTVLSREAFAENLSNAVNSNPSLYVFAQNADSIYDLASSRNINPELVVLRAVKEGFSPGTAYNYWGINCTNTGGGRDCEGYSSFNEGVDRFLDIVSRYSSLEEWMRAYSYIGAYWYNPGSSSLGGCYYHTHIYNESNMPSYVSSACSSNAPLCSKDNTAYCTPTTDADQTAYAEWQVMGMADLRKEIFGLDINEYGGIANDDIIMLSDTDAWSLLTGYSSRDEANSYATQSHMDARMTTIQVPIRVWASIMPGNYETKTITKSITVNSALADYYYNFFNDVYNEATDFVFVPSEFYCYSYRKTTSGTRLSAHAFGAACDINSSTDGNGYGDHVYTKSEWESMKKSKKKYQVIYKDSKFVEIAHRYTLSWGGEWNSVTDAMHVSFIGDESRATLQSGR